MDLSTNLKELSARVPSLIQNLRTEEAAKHSLVLPFIQALGYDVFNPSEVIPEFDANVGASKKYKLDYAILQNDKPIILIECKGVNEKLDKDAWGQLFHYFVSTNARIGILTNGLVYRFYTDLDKSNAMDETPFLEFDIQYIKESNIEELKKITKSSFNIDEMVSTASQLKYVGGIISLLNQQLDTPSDDFTKVFFSQLCPGRVFSPSAKTEFIEYTKKAMKLFLKEQVMNRFDSSDDSLLEPASISSSESSQPEVTSPDVDRIETTEQELQGFYIVKSLLYSLLDSSRIAYQDQQSYFNVLLDGKRQKPICRFYFNNPKKLRIALFDHSSDGKQEEKIAISQLDEIYQYGDRIKSTVFHYLN